MKLVPLTLISSPHLSPKHVDVISNFNFSPRISRAFSLQSNDFRKSRSQHLPYIISESQSEISTPIYDEETTDSLSSTMRARHKPNVYSPIANDLWNEEDIDDLHEEMSQQFARLTKRLSVESIHSFKAQRRTFNHKDAVVIEMDDLNYERRDILIEDEDKSMQELEKEMNAQMMHLAQLHNDAIECTL